MSLVHTFSRFTSRCGQILRLCSGVYRVGVKTTAVNTDQPLFHAMQRSPVPCFIVDSFTDQPFRGNPAAVCLLANEGDSKTLTDEYLQRIGSEMNLSETAFVSSTGDDSSFRSENEFGLRWFTPTVEVDLCGHATLAAAATLFKAISNQSETISFKTRSGVLKVRKRGEMFSMDFPLNPSQKQEIENVKDLLKVVVEEKYIQEVEYSPKTKKLLIRLSDSLTRSFLETLQPQISKMAELETSGRIKGVIVTLKGSESNGSVDKTGKQYDFISRYFAPWVGIPEDPVTGAAHTVLASYWSKQLNKTNLYARQCSARGGDIIIEVHKDRVHLAGSATIVMRGTLEI